MNVIPETIVQSPIKIRPVWLNDVHSQLNWTRVREVQTPHGAQDLQDAVRVARKTKLQISCAGGRHAMGGQQFGSGNLHLDLCDMNHVLSFDREHGILEVEAGIQWPQIIDYLLKTQCDGPEAWGIRQKQTGADRLSIGGALAANIHGRGLRMPPFVNDVESFTIVTADGKLLECSRTHNRELFRLTIGGYGLFGIVYSVRLRLSRRQRLRRVVKLTTTDELAQEFQNRIQEGCLFGDFQFAIDPQSDDFLRKGVFSCYEPVEFSSHASAHRQLTSNDWKRLLHLAHNDPTEAFNQYSRFYLSTNGQFYWSDTHQLSYYCDDYHREIDEATRCLESGSEMITELYVPRETLAAFMEAARVMLQRHNARPIYGTIRLIEEDRETFLAWARRNFACIVLNLHCDHNPRPLAKSAHTFRGLIDLALSFGGSFYLTYHRYATKGQMLSAYPQLPYFLEEKNRWDADGIFDSNWHRHLRALFS
ncbi:MAG TPA: FAD-binding oxidoreductase [Verrucomicrobiae bacterium]|nr:FAD-binding oxidoreductase [Verrucomicrobiae bacterium]